MLVRRASIAAMLLAGSAHAQSTSDYVVQASLETAQYADTDHVFVTTPSLTAKVAKPTAGWSVNGTYLVDVVSAASVDIVSTASGRWVEARQAGTLEADYKPGTFGVSLSGAVSDEPDYLSWAAGIMLSQELLEKNLTLFAGYDHVGDTAGRTGTPFSVFSHTIQTDGIKAGLTLLLDRATVATALADARFVNGDSSDPYRYVPLFAPGTYVPLGASIDTVNATRLSERVLEQVPLSRNRYALTLRVAHRFHASTVRLEERLYDDTWGLVAQTADARWLVDVGDRIEVGPHARLHDQSAVDFWQRAYELRSGFDFPAYRTGDRALGPLMTVTGGASLRVGIGPARAPMKWTLGLEIEAAYTRFLDDLYLTDRSSTLGALSIAGEL
ncbi:MAG: DUF3570 domain-containing protein [Polyangiaceae bacterium]